ncbi:MAG TPA: MYXO-CTERM sorting domain-containing protein, partial [Polyangiaceae bacterium]|nr:MYXO-CTERM sorting domain-containing protein [Polyangiaceae bacterium]
NTGGAFNTDGSGGATGNPDGSVVNDGSLNGDGALADGSQPDGSTDGAQADAAFGDGAFADGELADGSMVSDGGLDGAIKSDASSRRDGSDGSPAPDPDTNGTIEGGGCACTTPASRSATPPGVTALLLALGAGVWRRRRRSDQN